MELTQETHSAEIERCVAETVSSFVQERMTINELRDFHNQVNEQNRLAIAGESDVDAEALKFMHQVTKGALQQLNTRRKRQLAHMRSKNETRWSAYASNDYLL